MKTKKRPTKKTRNYVLPAGKALVLRTCDANLRSHEGFQWPKSGPVKAPDWDPKPECGHGLHGLLWGEGCADLLCWDESAKWLVVEIDPKTAVDLNGKVKYPSGRVVFVGDRSTAPIWLGEHGGAGRAIVRGTATAGYNGTATAGNRGTATAGYSGTATAGNNGTATAGNRGTATAGYGGTATAGERGTAKTGSLGIIVLRWWDGARYRVTVGYVGEDGIKPDTFYRCDEQGKLVEQK